MGNDMGVTAPQKDCFTEAVREVRQLQGEAMKEGGVYRGYLRARQYRDLACGHPFLRFSAVYQENCVAWQVRTIDAYLEAVARTNGSALLVTLVEK